MYHSLIHLHLASVKQIRYWYVYRRKG